MTEAVGLPVRQTGASAQQGFDSFRRSAQQGFESSLRSAQQGSESSLRSAQQGFTLVELLVALMIFSLLAGAGVLLLRGSVDTQAAVQLRLDELADVQRGIATLDADLSQVTQRISRTQSGTSAPAFFGRGPQQSLPIMEFVRGGWSNPANQRHPSVQKVQYWWRNNRLERVGYPAVDGAEAPEPAVLLDHVRDIRLRYRDPRGDWLEVWAPTQPNALPVAVEMIVTREAQAPLTLRFIVGPAVGQAVESTNRPETRGLDGF